MSTTKLVFLLALWLLSDHVHCVESGEVNGDGGSASNACTNCTICQYPCHPQPPPGYVSSGAPPPPGYLSYGAPPPPPVTSVGNCPPGVPIQCCQHSPPMPYYPYSNYSASSPLPSPSRALLALVFVLFWW